MNLHDLAPGAEAKISGYSPDLSRERKELVENFGLFVGNKIICVKKETSIAPGLYQVGSLKMAMEKEVTDKIQISVPEPEKTGNAKGSIS